MKALNKKDKDFEVKIIAGKVCTPSGKEMKVKENGKVLFVTKEGNWAVAGERKSRIIKKYGKTFVAGQHDSFYDEEDLDMIARNRETRTYSTFIEENVKGAGSLN